MAKEKNKGNREAKKPKAVKAPAAPAATSLLKGGSVTPIVPKKKG